MEAWGKIDTASPEDVQTVRENVQRVNPKAIVTDGASPINVDKPELNKGKRVLVVEDGPTLTHGHMKIGAASLLAKAPWPPASSGPANSSIPGPTPSDA